MSNDHTAGVLNMRLKSKLQYSLQVNIYIYIYQWWVGGFAGNHIVYPVCQIDAYAQKIRSTCVQLWLLK